MKYIGEKCVLCEKEFTDQDEVVVCPECGSPHHRSCYKLENKCANEDFHLEKKKWKPTAADEVKKQKDERKICPACHFPNLPNASNCIYCGAELSEDPENVGKGNGESESGAGASVNGADGYGADAFGIDLPPYLGFDPNEDLGGATLKEVSDFVSTNTIYYIPIFKRMKDLGKKVSFNLLCFIFPPIYFANRKMWLWAVLSAVITVLLGIPAAVSYLVSSGMRDGVAVFSAEIMEFIYDNKEKLALIIDLCNAADLVFRLLLCLFGNWLYFRFIVRNLKKLKAAFGGAELKKELLSAAGGVKPLNTLFIVLIFAAVSFISLYGVVFLINFLRLMLTSF